MSKWEYDSTEIIVRVALNTIGIKKAKADNFDVKLIPSYIMGVHLDEEQIYIDESINREIQNQY
jgi:hypothetical protein